MCKCKIIEAGLIEWDGGNREYSYADVKWEQSRQWIGLYWFKILAFHSYLNFVKTFLFYRWISRQDLVILVVTTILQLTPSEKWNILFEAKWERVFSLCPCITYKPLLVFSFRLLPSELVLGEVI